MPARPFLKWAGGKGQLLAELTARLPMTFARYHEPFVGGGAFFFHLWNHGLLAHGAVLSDSNPELIDCYEVVREHVEDLIELLVAMRVHFADRDFFYEVRSWDRQANFHLRPKVERAARTIFLNRTCYNGLYRLNNKRQFNAPFGNYKKPLIVDPDNMREVSRALREVELRVEHFDGVLQRARPDDLIYFDPPYVPVSPTSSFTAYTHRGFTEVEQRELAHTFFALADRGCAVMLSNSHTPLVAELYAPATTNDIVMASRKINCDGKKRGEVAEMIVCSFPVGLVQPRRVALLAQPVVLTGK